MAISRIPGVGPTNSDIAATIATTPAVSAQITANVPTAAAIATAVAAPSLAQITSAITSNAASAGVTMAAITSSITTNAASAGVTMAAITSAIQSNAGFSGNYTLLASGTPPGGTTTITFSWSGTYRRIIVACSRLQTAGGSENFLKLQLNGDTTAANYPGVFTRLQGTTSTLELASLWEDYGFAGAPIGNLNTSARGFGIAEISGANGSTIKTIETITSVSGVTKIINNSKGFWTGTGAVTSVTLQITSSTIALAGIIYVIGVN